MQSVKITKGSDIHYIVSVDDEKPVDLRRFDKGYSEIDRLYYRARAAAGCVMDACKIADECGIG